MQYCKNEWSISGFKLLSAGKQVALDCKVIDFWDGSSWLFAVIIAYVKYSDEVVLVAVQLIQINLYLFCSRSQRLQFDVSSPNGILLFREVSKVIVGYGLY
jgi:hypothetical protein